MSVASMAEIADELACGVGRLAARDFDVQLFAGNPASVLAALLESLAWMMRPMFGVGAGARKRSARS